MNIPRNAPFLVGIILIASLALAAIFAPWLAPSDPMAMDLASRFQPPSAQHLFGLDQNGSDLLSQILYGARVSLGVALAVVAVSCATGLLLGSIAGYAGGWVDLLLMRALDMVHAFPGFLLALALVAVLGPAIPNLVIAMSLTGWTGYARLVRGEVLHLKNREYVWAAIAAGCPSTRVLLRHIWPNLFSVLAVQATFGLAGAVLTESGLSFLGLGAPANVPTWGSILNNGRRSLAEAPHISLIAGLAILALVLGFNLIGEGLRRHLDRRDNG